MKKLFSFLLIFLMILPISCRKTVPKTIISSSNLSSDQNQVQQAPAEIEKTNQEKKNPTKHEWISTDRKPWTPDFRKNKSLVLMDPYKDIRDYYLEKGLENFTFNRFYKDFDGDSIPELCLVWDKGSGGINFTIYRILRGSYLYLGNISSYSYQVLKTTHFGYPDIMVFWRLGTGGNSDINGALSYYEYDEQAYTDVKSIDNILLSEAYEEFDFAPNDADDFDHGGSIYATNSDQWLTKDDDKYRDMIK